jgi:high-affinity iron transporter
MEAAVKAGQPAQAESARLEAYAIYELGAEKRLLAFAPDLANETEALFWGGTGDTEGLAVAISRGATAAEVHESRLALDQALAESQERVGAGRPATAVVIFNAATIVFREGLEAVLILASLVASMIGANQKYKKPLVAGAGLAFLATALLFWAAQTVLQSLARYGEKLEAVISLIAIGVLLVVMNWFFHKVYWTKWISKHHTQRRAVLGGAVAGQVAGLVILGFTSVFREGAETVLFLQALVLDAGTWVVIQGTLLGLLGTAIVGALVMVLQKKLPHKKMLSVTGVMLAFVLVVMVGNTVHVMQVVGWMPISPIPGLVLPYWMGTWFGLYATWQGVALQVVALVVVIGSYYAAEWVNHGGVSFRRRQSQTSLPA